MILASVRKVVRHGTRFPTRHQSTGLAPRPSRLRYGQNQSDPRGWESVIGLEVHAQILALSKLFSAGSGRTLGSANSQVTLFDASIPGTLPVINRRCVEAAVQTALALQCRINPVSTFDRKHYFYADLPTGYQITQQRKALAVQGQMDFSVLRSENVPHSYYHSVGITQLQLEQDSGKSLHDAVAGKSLIDLNRCGMGLMEIVFEPQLSDGEEAAAMIHDLILILKRLGTCSCKMEEGALRVDANISVNRPGEPLGVRTEVKNLNSIRSLANAIEFEVSRQIAVLESGGIVENETRSFNFSAKQTLPMRDKEAKQDYRFLPEPNLPPLRLCDTPPGTPTDKTNPHIINIHDYRETLPEMPNVQRQRLMTETGISIESASQLVDQPNHLAFFEKAMTHKPQNPQILVNLLQLSVVEMLNILDISLEQSHLSAGQLVELAEIKHNDELPHNIILKALKTLVEKHYPSAESLIQEMDWRSTVRNVNLIQGLVTEALRNEKKLVKRYFKGKDEQKVAVSLAKIVDKSYPGDLDMKLVTQVIRDSLKEMATNTQ
ncbi:hypothetical protein TCAL_10086 [Tigriopus californicus]|uniref:Glutamyl-tRNA(Gln) amidotransferase subunit B, mitochondrial n=1 Tax=Tigriopus californicus TaxID=6832 RepID=A0A553PC41_TIGCA|nr:glutamyl-tRNA(Gln) amidotransferase subunit B, mitochondrial-like [Tigriopus californicus]TRY75252.1 hypothetical protein TCAL_10086 [Tigriopus californicus]|eukprot:TCALIF_10086-PA protein Name:"Similar to CG5463 Glutamyl-tRNA(Gln) amidotransferase subunit B, mitochondrial (Drosophila melanogaster)" AED:0.04 eAED:0.04 QI:148/1/1/1/1/1/5/15/548